MSLTDYEMDLLDEGVQRVSKALNMALDGNASHDIKILLAAAKSYLSELQEKMEYKRLPSVMERKGRKRNPPLILLSNPPMRYKGSRSGHGSLKFLDLISDEAHAILYRHIEDGKPYRHDFERPTQLVAVERNGKKDVLITSEDDSPIWQDF